MKYILYTTAIGKLSILLNVFYLFYFRYQIFEALNIPTSINIQTKLTDIHVWIVLQLSETIENRLGLFEALSVELLIYMTSPIADTACAKSVFEKCAADAKPEREFVWFMTFRWRNYCK